MNPKFCPFLGNKCVGEQCINFEWRLFEKESKARGSCKFFDRWTGHEIQVPAQQQPIAALDG
jgi:hypothetical protein